MQNVQKQEAAAHDGEQAENNVERLAGIAVHIRQKRADESGGKHGERCQRRDRPARQHCQCSGGISDNHACGHMRLKCGHF